MVNFFLIVRSMVNGCKAKSKERMMGRYAMSWKHLNDKERNPQKYARLTDEEVDAMKKKFEARKEARRAKKEAEENEKEQRDAEQEIEVGIALDNAEDQGFSGIVEDESVRSDVRLIDEVPSPNKVTRPPLTTGEGIDS